jgi:phenylacetate-CoA ligase
VGVDLILRVGAHLARSSRRGGWARPRIAAHQSERLSKLRRYALQNSPFYRTFHRGLEASSLSELPILTKPVLMDNFDQLVTDRRVKLTDVQQYLSVGDFSHKFLGHYHVTSTSGTTGRRGIFLSDTAEWAEYLAALARVSVWAGKRPSLTHRRRTANVGSTVPFTVSARAAATVGSPLAQSLRMDTHDPLDKIVARLNDWQPSVLSAYASMAGLLAREQLAGRLAIKPELVVSAAEVLTSDIRGIVQKAWGDVLFNLYAATEAALGAECCHHTGIHLFEDVVIPEVVDDAGRPVPPGEYGERLLVTVLYRHTQPLIRYEISDMVRLAANPCPCGRAFMLADSIQGRREDVLWFPRIGGGQVQIDPIFFEPILGPIRASAWQLTREPDRLVVLFSGLAQDLSTEEVGELLRSKITEANALAPPVTVVRVDAIPRGATGKAPLIISKTSQDN